MDTRDTHFPPPADRSTTMNKTLIALAVIAVAAGFGPSALAQDTTPTRTSASAQAQTSQTAQSAQPVDHTKDPNCIRDTGSHIPPPKGGCLPVSGRSYSHEDLERTGQTNVGRALQQLDPSVSVHGGGG